MKKTLKDLFDELLIEVKDLFEFHKLLVGDRGELICKNFKYLIAYDNTDKVPMMVTVYNAPEGYYTQLLQIVILGDDYVTTKFNKTWLLDTDEFNTLLLQVKEDMKEYINYDKLYPVDYHLFLTDGSTELMVEDFMLDELPS
jgi:hypothetical protein